MVSGLPTGALAGHLSAARLAVVPAASFHQDRGVETISGELAPLLAPGHAGLIHIGEELVYAILQTPMPESPHSR